MEVFKNYSKLVNQYQKLFPQEISVLISMHKGTGAILYDAPYYRFVFSENGQKHKEKNNKKYKNSKTLYEDVLVSFLDNKRLISLAHYNKKILNYECAGIVLKNNKGEKLNLYFSQDVLKEFITIDSRLRFQKQYDFYRYCSALIKRKSVENLVFKPSENHESSISYEFYKNYGTGQIPCKYQEIEYCYNEENKCVDVEDLTIIYELICQFIDLNLDENMSYEYIENANCQTIELRIRIGDYCRITIKGDELIYPLEKMGIIDNLYKIIYKKADGMSEKNGLKLLRIKDE